MIMLRPIQFLTVSLHSAVVLWIVWWLVFVSSPNHSLWYIAWINLLGYLDLPATVVYFVLAKALGLHHIQLHLPHPFGSVGGFWLPLLCYGIIGTWWWYKLPAWFFSGARWLHKKVAV